MLGAIALAATDATVADDAAVDLVVTDAWARESPPGAVSGAAYMTIVNNGAKNWVLEGVAGDVAKRVELHSHIDDDGVMRMRPVDFIEIKPGVSAVLEPGGLHVMLIGIKAPLKAGERFPLTLNSKEGDDIQIQVEVRAPGGR
jgi:copper(I)-binding protein